MTNKKFVKSVLKSLVNHHLSGPRRANICQFLSLFIFSYSPIIVIFIYSLNREEDTSEQNKLLSDFVPHVYKGIIA